MGQCMIISMLYSGESWVTNPRTLGILTRDEVGEFIEMFGEVFRVTKLEPETHYKRIKITCDHFPKSKDELFEDTGNHTFINISREEFAKRYTQNAREQLTRPVFMEDELFRMAPEDFKRRWGEPKL